MTDVPLSELLAHPASYLPDRGEAEQIHVYVVCRLGNDSQIAARALRDVTDGHQVKDVIGGLRAWSRDVDRNFPVY